MTRRFGLDDCKVASWFNIGKESFGTMVSFGDGKMVPFGSSASVFGKGLEERFMGQLDIARYHDSGFVCIYVTKRRILMGLNFKRIGI